MPDQDARRSLLREALAQRRQEVLARLRELPQPQEGEVTTAAPPDDPEELLRVVMVRLWPRIQKRRATPMEEDDFLRGVMGLALLARTDDWRFLDVWNQAFESLGLLAGGPSPAVVRAFLAQYDGLLDHHLQIL